MQRRLTDDSRPIHQHDRVCPPSPVVRGAAGGEHTPNVRQNVEHRREHRTERGIEVTVDDEQRHAPGDCPGQRHPPLLVGRERTHRFAGAGCERHEVQRIERLVVLDRAHMRWTRDVVEHREMAKDPTLLGHPTDCGGKLPPVQRSPRYLDGAGLPPKTEHGPKELRLAASRSSQQGDPLPVLEDQPTMLSVVHIQQQGHPQMVVAKAKPPSMQRRARDVRVEALEGLLQIGKLPLTGTDVDEVLSIIARGVGEVAGYRRCLIAAVEGGANGTMKGRAGYGLSLEDMPRVDELLSDVPVLAAALGSRAPLVLQPEDLAGAVPEQYLDLFQVVGTLILLPLHERRLGPLGIAFVDKAGSRFYPAPEELEMLADFASLAVQNAVLVRDSRRLSSVLERSRLATEVHDGVTQNLFALALTLQAILELPDLPKAADGLVQSAQQDVAEGSQHLRRALFTLTQDQVDTPSLETFEDEIRQLAVEFSHRSGIGADVEVRGEGRQASAATLDLLRRTAREGLNNVLKHASARQVTLVLRRSDHWWMLEVHDDGEGDAAALRRGSGDLTPGHLGLTSLRREAATQQSRLWLSQSPRLGAQLAMSAAVRL